MSIKSVAQEIDLNLLLDGIIDKGYDGLGVGKIQKQLLRSTVMEVATASFEVGIMEVTGIVHDNGVTSLVIAGKEVARIERLTIGDQATTTYTIYTPTGIQLSPVMESLDQALQGLTQILNVVIDDRISELNKRIQLPTTE